MKKEQKTRITDSFWSKLHELAGFCGHCNRPKCPDRITYSVMPEKIKFKHVQEAFEYAVNKR